MATPMNGIKDRIYAIVGALTPSEDTARTFAPWAPRKGLPSGASGHHAMRCEHLGGGESHAQGADLSEKTRRVKLVITYSAAGLDSDALFGALSDDSSAIMNAIDRGVGFPAGTAGVETDGYAIVERTDGADVDLEIFIDIDLEET